MNNYNSHIIVIRLLCFCFAIKLIALHYVVIGIRLFFVADTCAFCTFGVLCLSILCVVPQMHVTMTFGIVRMGSCWQSGLKCCLLKFDNWTLFVLNPGLTLETEAFEKLLEL